jgi:hypothetical protein
MVPINKYTAAIVCLSGGGGIAGIVNARRGKQSGSRWIERTAWALALLVAIAFGISVWAAT